MKALITYKSSGEIENVAVSSSESKLGVMAVHGTERYSTEVDIPDDFSEKDLFELANTHILDCVTKSIVRRNQESCC